MYEKRKLGATDLVVSQICLGSNQFGTALDQARTNDVLDAFASIGGNFIDTARGYGDWIPNAPKGASERAIGAWLKGKNRDDFVIATKGGMVDMRAGDWAPRVTPQHLALDLAESLEHLGVKSIDLYWVHVDDPSKPVEPLIEALIGHREAGRIRHFGLSNWSPQRVAAAQAHAQKLKVEGVVAVQPFWGLATPNIEAAQQQGYGAYFEDGYRPLLEQGMAIVPYGSQSRGFFAKLENEGEGGMREDVKAMFLNDANRRRLEMLKALAREHKTSLAAVTLSYMTSQPRNVFPIIGASSSAQVLETAAALKIKLNEAELQRLRTAE
ncbi:MAG: aldo/keto reductase [Hyphomonadaceae bacterium]|nr:aldo/keto reductase [Hyphomonadaceae bacterium]